MHPYRRTTGICHVPRGSRGSHGQAASTTGRPRAPSRDRWLLVVPPRLGGPPGRDRCGERGRRPHIGTHPVSLGCGPATRTRPNHPRATPAGPRTHGGGEQSHPGAPGCDVPHHLAHVHVDQGHPHLGAGKGVGGRARASRGVVARSVTHHRGATPVTLAVAEGARAPGHDKTRQRCRERDGPGRSWGWVHGEVHPDLESTRQSPMARDRVTMAQQRRIRNDQQLPIRGLRPGGTSGPVAQWACVVRLGSHPHPKERHRGHP
jgi:hypothetical protein